MSLTRFILIISIFFTNQADSQGLIIDTLCQINEIDNQMYIFPIIHCEHSNISNKINSHLQRDFLDNSNISNPNIFQSVWSSTEGETAFLSNIEIDSYIIHEKYLSIQISALGCGAYCERFYTVYNFDMTTGEAIKSASLFTQNGLITITAEINKMRTQMIREHMTTLSQYKPNITDSSEAQHYEGALSMYDSCNTKINLEYAKFGLNLKNVKITIERCSNHAERALDELGEYVYVYELSEIEEYLSPYGKKLLLN